MNDPYETVVSVINEIRAEKAVHAPHGMENIRAVQNAMNPQERFIDIQAFELCPQRRGEGKP